MKLICLHSYLSYDTMNVKYLLFSFFCDKVSTKLYMAWLTLFSHIQLYHQFIIGQLEKSFYTLKNNDLGQNKCNVLYHLIMYRVWVFQRQKIIAAYYNGFLNKGFFSIQ